MAISGGENCGISTIFNRENLIMEVEMKWSNLITNFEINAKDIFFQVGQVQPFRQTNRWDTVCRLQSSPC
jgi:hypothetical protein